jgi:hypothetical protein
VLPYHQSRGVHDCVEIDLHRHAAPTRSEFVTNRILLALAALVVCALSACAEQHYPRAAGQSAKVVVLRDPEQFPCSLSISPTGVEIRSDMAATTPDVGRHLTRDARGRYWAASSPAGQLHSWWPDGQYAVTLGSFGDGPEELRLVAGIIPGVDDRVHIFHRPGHWSIVREDEIIEKRTFPALRLGSANTLLTADGGLVVTGFLSEAREYSIHRIGADGNRIKSFRRWDEDEAEYLDEPMRTARLQEDGTFWAGPRQSQPGSYVIEKWTEDGEHVQTIRREADWLNYKPVREGILGLPGLFITAFSRDVVMVWASVPPGATGGDGRRIDHWFDFIDVSTPRILESVRRDVYWGPRKHPLNGYFSLSGQGFIMYSDESLLRHAQIVNVKLKQSPLASGRCFDSR